MTTHSTEYETYMQSQEWADVREEALERAGRRCERCRYEYGLQVHHHTYARLGNELPEDLEVLCAPCHAQADAERAQDTEVRRWHARVSGWARKVYGDAWETRHSWDQVESRFVRWIERRGEHVS